MPAAALAVPATQPFLTGAVAPVAIPLPTPVMNQLVNAAVEAVQTLRAVMHHTLTHGPDAPLPKGLNQARIVAGQVIRTVVQVFKPAPARKPGASSATTTPAPSPRPSLADLRQLTEFADILATAPGFNADPTPTCEAPSDRPGVPNPLDKRARSAPAAALAARAGAPSREPRPSSLPSPTVP